MCMWMSILADRKQAPSGIVVRPLALIAFLKNLISPVTPFIFLEFTIHKDGFHDVISFDISHSLEHNRCSVNK